MRCFYVIIWDIGGTVGAKFRRNFAPGGILFPRLCGKTGGF
jgi:hypothetical protein